MREEHEKGPPTSGSPPMAPRSGREMWADLLGRGTYAVGEPRFSRDGFLLIETNHGVQSRHESASEEIIELWHRIGSGENAERRG